MFDTMSGVPLVIVSDCPKASVPAALSDKVACVIPDICTGIDCCAELYFLGGRTINTQVLLDPCQSVMSLNLEKMQYNITLFDYEFGTTDHFSLQGALRLE